MGLFIFSNWCICCMEKDTHAEVVQTFKVSALKIPQIYNSSSSGRWSTVFTNLNICIYAQTTSKNRLCRNVLNCTRGRTKCCSFSCPNRWRNLPSFNVFVCPSAHKKFLSFMLWCIFWTTSLPFHFWNQNTWQYQHWTYFFFETGRV